MLLRWGKALTLLYAPHTAAAVLLRRRPRRTYRQVMATMTLAFKQAQAPMAALAQPMRQFADAMAAFQKTVAKSPTRKES